MKPVSEISSAIQGPYREIQHEYLTKLHKLPDIIRDSDPEITKLRVNLIKDLSTHFKVSLNIIFKELIAKKPINSPQNIYDHFAIWLTCINSFKNQLNTANRPRARNIHEPLIDPAKNKINQLIKEIAQRTSEGKTLGIKRLETNVIKLANTEDLIKYREQQEQYWQKYFADKKLQSTISTRKFI